MFSYIQLVLWIMYHNAIKRGSRESRSSLDPSRCVGLTNHHRHSCSPTACFLVIVLLIDCLRKVLAPSRFAHRSHRVIIFRSSSRSEICNLRSFLFFYQTNSAYPTWWDLRHGLRCVRWKVSLSDGLFSILSRICTRNFTCHLSSVYSEVCFLSSYHVNLSSTSVAKLILISLINPVTYYFNYLNGTLTVLLSCTEILPL